VGAFVFPLVLMLFTRANNGYWVYACWFLTMVGVIAWILYFIIPEDDDKKTDSGETDAKDKVRETLGFFKEPLFYICTATLFFYLCAETGVIGWMITYFKDTGLLNPNLSQVTASILWIMILAGRLTVAWLSTKYRKENLLPVMGIGIVVFFLVLIISKTTAPIIIGIMGFGYSMAGIYATTVSFAGDIIKKYNLAWSFILTIASLGSIIMPAIIGLIAENYGIAMGISSIAVALFLDMMCIMKLVTHVKKKAVV
jgi:fucose permease